METGKGTTSKVMQVPAASGPAGEVMLHLCESRGAIVLPYGGASHGLTLRCAARASRSVQARGQHVQPAPADSRAGRQRPALADRGERAVRHRLAGRLLGGRSAGRPSGAGALPGRRRGSRRWRRNAGQALDYVKAPLFDVALGRVLPASGAASADDLQDLLTLYLEQCKNAGGEMFAFGAKFDAEPAQADRHRVRQHRRPARHPRHPPQPGEHRATRRRQRRLSRRRADPRPPRSLRRAVPRVPDPARPDRRRRRRGARRAGHRPDPDRRAGPAAGDGLDDLHGARADQPGRRGRRTRDRRDRQPRDHRADAERLATRRQERPRHADRRDARLPGRR